MLLLPTISLGNTVSVNWTNSAVPGTNPPQDLNNILGAPDFNIADFKLFPNVSATLSNFNINSTYDSGAFASLLGISESALNNADVIVFEYNGSPRGQVENSTWTFSAGGSTEVFNLVYSGSDDSSDEGTVSNSNYASFFNTANIFGNTGDFAFALFDLSLVNASASDFQILIEGGNEILGTPDLDSIGVISSVPIPGAAILFMSGLFGLLLQKKEANSNPR